MKKTAKTTFTLILTALILTGFTACNKGPAPSTTTASSSTVKAYETTAYTLDVTDDSDDGSDVASDDISDTSEPAESSEAKSDSRAPDGAFSAAELIKIGEHTYYQDSMFERGRDQTYKDYMLSQLEKADKDLHDDVYVTGIGEAEEHGEFRFFGKMMNDGVIYNSADMTCWYDSEKGNFWEIDYSKFRRTDFSKNGILPAEDFFGEIYERASKSDEVWDYWDDITGTYLLAVDSEGNLYYHFTINKYSTVDVDAKTGEIILERYWNGDYT